VTTAVVDANVLVSGFVRRNPASAAVRVIDAWRAGLFTLALSDDIIAEVERTLREPYFSLRLAPKRIADDLALLRSEAIRTTATAQVHGVATHPEDDLVLAAAVSARADYLVTGDTKLLVLGTYQDVRIVGPRAFLDALEREQPGLGLTGCGTHPR